MTNSNRLAEAGNDQGDLDSVDRDILKTFNSGINCALQKDRNKSCVQETGYWFFHDPLYQEFRDAASAQLLFVTAEAGGGKSTVMQTFVDRLLENREGTLTAYFFFKDDVDDLRSYEKALSSLIYQILVQEKSLLKYTRGAYQKYGDGLRNDTKAMWELLLAFSHRSRREVCCVFDAMDECETIGRNQLLSDFKSFFGGGETSDSRLKFVVSSRPYQDENHRYTSLFAKSQNIRHIVGEDARVQSEIFKVIQFKADELTRERGLSSATRDMLVEKLCAQNQHTRSFLGVHMAFELLDCHHRMHKGAGERTVSTIVSEIPQSLGSKFDALLDRSINKEHTRRLFCVMLATRKLLKIEEFKVIYAVTQPISSKIGKARSYDDLELLSDDEEFKLLVRARCGLFITFVKNYVHFFHQTAREYLLEQSDVSQEGTSAILLQSGSQPTLIGKPSWGGSISLRDANVVCASMCLDIVSFEVPKNIPFELFDNLEAGNHIDESFPDDSTEGFKGFISARPFFHYAACNWHEHMVLAEGNWSNILLKDCYKNILDLSKRQFWAWFLTLADYVCSQTLKKRRPVSNIWTEKERVNDFGVFLRERCLQRIFRMDDKLLALLDPLSHGATDTDQITWTAHDGFHFIDRFHVANGDYQHTSFNRAVEAIEQGDRKRASALLAKVPQHTLIWTAITAGAPLALEEALSTSKDLSWLQNIPEHIIYSRRKSSGWSGRNGKDLRELKQSGWTQRCPPTFSVMLKLSMLDSSELTFKVLADWIDEQTDKQLFAQQFWEAGGFIIPSLSRRLVDSGASVDCELWQDRATALQVACSFWVHGAIRSLAEIGASTSRRTLMGYNALHCFFHYTDISTGTTWESKIEKEHATYFFNKSRIQSSVKAIIAATPAKQALLSQKCDEGLTPLMLGAQSRRSSGTAIKCLLDQGAGVDQRDDQGRTALMRFFLGDDEFVERDTSILKHLLLAGANPLTSDMSGISALGHWASRTASVELNHLFAGFNTYNKSFNILANLGSLSLQALGAELSRIKVPLVVASRLGNAQMCSALLSAGADPNEKHDIYRTWFREHRKKEVDTKPNEDEYTLEWNPLMVALQSRAYVTAAILIEYGADVNFILRKRQKEKYNGPIFTKGGGTPLHLAIAAGEDFWGNTWSSISPCAAEGLEACAFRGGEMMPNRRGRRLLELWRATAYKDPRDQDEEDSDPECDIRRTVFANDHRGSNLVPYDKPNNIQQLFDTSIDPYLASVLEETSSFEQRQESVVRFMLSRGASSSACTIKNVSVLMLSVKLGLSKIVEILLESGADPNIAEFGGATPLIVAAHRGNATIIEQLLLAGANPNAQLSTKKPEKCKCASLIQWHNWGYKACDAPYTALAVAVWHGHEEAVELLLKHGADPNLKISHHVHGRLPSKTDLRRQKRYLSSSSDDDSDPEPEEWKGFISVGTPLTWAQGHIRDLLLRDGADPTKQESVRECGCIIKPRPSRHPWSDDSDDDVLESVKA